MTMVIHRVRCVIAKRERHDYHVRFNGVILNDLETVVAPSLLPFLSRFCRDCLAACLCGFRAKQFAGLGASSAVLAGRLEEVLGSFLRVRTNHSESTGERAMSPAPDSEPAAAPVAKGDHCLRGLPQLR